MTHQMTRFVIDAEKAVLNRPQPDSRVCVCLLCCVCLSTWRVDGWAAGRRGMLNLWGQGHSQSDHSPVPSTPHTCRLRTVSLRRARCTPSTSSCPPGRASPSEHAAIHYLVPYLPSGEGFCMVPLRDCGRAATEGWRGAVLTGGPLEREARRCRAVAAQLTLINATPC
jgi:hypothetical protein